MVDNLEDLSRNQMIKKDDIEHIIEKNKQKYLNIINNLTDKIKDAGCELEHPFDKKSMSIKNTRAEKAEATLITVRSFIENCYKSRKIPELDYRILLDKFDA